MNKSINLILQVEVFLTCVLYNSQFPSKFIIFSKIE